MTGTVGRLAEAAAAHRSRIAIEDASGELTYRHWWDEVRRWAETVRRAVPDGGCVAVCVERGPHAITAVVGCLVSGRTYVPFDPGLPVQRTTRMLADCAPTALIAPVPTAGALPAAARPPVVIDLHRREVRADLRGTAAPRGGFADAYVLYTSGSTGAPKGVRISTGNLAAFVGWACDTFAIGTGDRLPVCASLSFDIAVLDVFAGLSGGATLCPVDGRTLMFPRSFAEFLRARRISVSYAVPTLYENLLARAGLDGGALDPLRQVLYAGEDFPPRWVRRLREVAPKALVANLYGPVETNVVTWHEVSDDDLDGARIPIGRPVPGTTVALWDERRAAAAPPDAPGELIVAGPTVSPGYLDDPERTTASRLGAFYRTGDLARYDPRGRLVLVGRRDAMFKSRGYRVEPGDIEATLVEHPAVARAAVFPVPAATSLTIHAAVTLTPAAPVDEAVLLGWCRDRLPAHLVPERVHVVIGMPATRTGKLDRRALAARLAGAAP